MPAEWAPHERTIMGWPCRDELWGDQLGQAKADYAATANAVAAFEPLTMVCADAQDADEARAALAGEVEVVELPIDDSWLRDSGPIFVLDDRGRRAGVHFGFNSWGEKFTPYDADAAVGGLLIDRLGDRRYEAPFVLEGGSVAVDGEGTLLTTEQCLLHPNRNPDMAREEIEQGLRDFLGVEQVVWLGQGLAEDRDTDGHVDLIAAFTRPGEVLLQSTPLGTPSSERMADNRSRLVAAGLEVVDFPLLPTLEVGGEEVAVGHLNFYLCNGAVIVPVAGLTTDAEALERIGAAYPDRAVVGVPGGVIAFGGGGPHCITQQVPVARDGYERVAAVADELLAGQAGPSLATDTLFPPGSGHPTPKVDVRAVIVRDGRLLLVRERTDGRWAMPGGWADPGLSPAQIAVKETAEEAGLEVRATRLLALWDRDAQGMEPYAHAVYKAYLSCAPVDPAAEPVPGPEALDAGWFEPAALPELSLTRNTGEQVQRLVALAADPAAPAAFD